MGTTVFNSTLGCVARFGKELQRLQQFLQEKVGPQLSAFLCEGGLTREGIVLNTIVNAHPQLKAILSRFIVLLKPVFGFIKCKVISFFNQRNAMVQLQVKLFAESAKDTYEEQMRNILSKNPFIEENELTNHHIVTKFNLAASYNSLEKSLNNVPWLQQIKEKLFTDVDGLFEELKKKQASGIEKKMKEATALLDPFQQEHLMNLKEKAFELETPEELVRFHEQQKMRMVNELRATSPIPASSSWFDILSKLLVKKLGRAKATVSRDWKSKITKGLMEVENVYNELYTEEVDKEDGNKLLNSPRSLESHRKIRDASILKCIQENLAPPCRRFIAESKRLLDNVYKEQISKFEGSFVSDSTANRM